MTAILFLRTFFLKKNLSLLAKNFNILKDNMEFNLHYLNDSYNELCKTDTHFFFNYFNDNANFTLYHEPFKSFNENFTDMDLLPRFELPFNDSFTDINILLNSEPLFNENFIEVAPNSEPFPNDNFTDIDISPNPKQLIDDNFESISNLNSNDYQYNLAEGDYFDDWESVDIFMHKYCLERGFGYQICRNEKNPNDFTIRRKTFGG